ncbi:hypothetical protein GCM10022243_32160 [Saccharothrix violaceirubra]|uniref:Uncharacterized protein n=1 Tax=Saccharothrix violaceirubra TaxID=413306 RepID=A0A7W7T595_9PSEU|nr:hypothetical protein [Saccharothrix violaceirubra]MBB4966838.1 hypothetical protein [Saccharothrix violaceirubra]
MDVSDHDIQPRSREPKTMLASRRNRGIHSVDDPWYDDGGNTVRPFKARRQSGKSGKRLWRRILRKVERREWLREVVSY